MDKLIKVKNLSKSYDKGTKSFWALKNINIEIENGELVCIVGESGSGKSTFMNILGCLDVQTSGEYILNGNNLLNLNENKKAKIRNEYIGFIFQKFNLLNNLNVYDNVRLPLVYKESKTSNVNELVKTNLERVGILDKIYKSPKHLSGGQQQRVCIARALINNPKVIFADEPTGSLDEKNEQLVMDIFKDLNKQGKTIIIITHSKKVAKFADRRVEIKNGSLIREF